MMALQLYKKIVVAAVIAMLFLGASMSVFAQTTNNATGTMNNGATSTATTTTGTGGTINTSDPALPNTGFGDQSATTWGVITLSLAVLLAGMYYFTRRLKS